MEENKVAASKQFFKVLVPGFHKKLNLPPAFCMKLLKQEKEKSAEWGMLKSRKGTFKIKVSRNREAGIISFEGAGWPQFVDQHSLRVGDFLVFQHVGRLNFDVIVFDPSACVKEFVVELKRENENAENDVANPTCPKKSKREGEKKSTVTSYNRRNPFVKPYHEKYADVIIPIEFVRSNNLWEKTSATLRDGCRRSWQVTLLSRTCKNQFRLSIRKGWRAFYADNELKVGDVCAFYLNPGPPTSMSTIIFDVKIRHSV